MRINNNKKWVRTEEGYIPDQWLVRKWALFLMVCLGTEEPAPKHRAGQSRRSSKEGNLCLAQDEL